MNRQHLCPVCGKTTFPERDSFNICPVCGWEDDYLQLKYPDYWGGANEMCLNDYKKNWLEGKPCK